MEMNEDYAASEHRTTIGSYDKPPSLIEPPLRTWELNETSSRYDRSFAAPSQETLRIMWYIWAVVFFVFSMVILIVFQAMIRSKKVRRKPFNLYLIFLIFPDFLFAFLCSFTCLYLALNLGYEYPIICKIQSFYATFGLGANSWLNAVIGFEVHRLLLQSHQGIRFQPLPLARVIRNSLCCYLWGILFAICGVFRETLPLWPTVAHNGLVCLPGEYNKTTTLFFWLLGVPLLMGIPLLYVIYVTSSVLYYKLLPPSGRRRQLAIYCFRVLSAFLVFWMPCLLVVYALGGARGASWAAWAFGLWGHFQGVTSAIIIAQKDDIKKVVYQSLCLRKQDAMRDAVNSRPFGGRSTVTGALANTTITSDDSRGLPQQNTLSGAGSYTSLSAPSLEIIVSSTHPGASIPTIHEEDNA